MNKKLSELELIELCNFITDPKNKCKIVADREDIDCAGERLRQTLYLYEKTSEYVFIAKQKECIISVLRIETGIVEEFKNLLEQGMLDSYGNKKNQNKMLLLNKCFYN